MEMNRFEIEALKMERDKLTTKLAELEPATQGYGATIERLIDVNKMISDWTKMELENAQKTKDSNIKAREIEVLEAQKQRDAELRSRELELAEAQKQREAELRIKELENALLQKEQDAKMQEQKLASEEKLSKRNSVTSIVTTVVGGVFKVGVTLLGVGGTLVAYGLDEDHVCSKSVADFAKQHLPSFGKNNL